jgi:hypothetical protein
VYSPAFILPVPYPRLAPAPDQLVAQCQRESVVQVVMGFPDVLATQGQLVMASQLNAKVSMHVGGVCLFNRLVHCYLDPEYGRACI